MDQLGSNEREPSAFGADSDQLDEFLRLGLTDGADEQPSRSAATGGADFVERVGSRIGRYTLLDVLGEGGMGIVYLAEQSAPVRREVALKILKPGMDSTQVIARFQTEQQALALMDHPHVARVYDAGLAPSGRPYFVMEHVRGTRITEYCDEHKLNIDERLGLFLHVCEAVQHAHQKGIIHRDLKPSNILVVVEDAEALPKVIDFGVARAIAQPLSERTLYTRQGQLVGTPGYISPEQADPGNQDIDTRTDVYSLGAVLYELLAGMLPHDPGTLRKGGLEHIRKVICEEDPKTPSARLSKTSIDESTEAAQRRRTDVRTLRRTLCGDLDWITLKAIEKDRARRYSTVEALATDIRRYLHHEPVSAAPPGTLYRVRKFARRHRQAIVVASLLMAASAAIGLGLLSYLQAGVERHRAESLQHARLLSQAQTLFRQRKHAEAEAVVAPLLDSEHVGRQATLLHAQLMLDDPNLAAAIQEFESLLDEHDDIAGQAHFHLANIYYESDPWAPEKTQENREKHEHHRRQAEALLAGTAQYYYLQAKATRVVRAKLTLLDEALRTDPSHYDSLRERAYIHYAQKDYPRMAEDAARMIGMRPTDSTAYLLRAIARREMGRFAEALRDHDETIRLSPGEAKLYDQRRRTYMDLGEHELALSDARKTAELQPECITYHFHVFAALTGLGDYAAAEQQYQRILEHPDAITVYSSFWPYPDGAIHAKFWLKWWACQCVSDALVAGRAWHAPGPAPTGEAFFYLNESAIYRDNLTETALRVCSNGTHACWSPDGTRLAYTTGGVGRRAIAVYDTNTGRTQLLAIPGRESEWSPDGQYVAFAGGRQSLSLETFVDIEGNWEARRTKGPPRGPSEVWILQLATSRLWSLGQGHLPHWAEDSRHVYYRSNAESKLYRASIEQGRPEPEALMNDAGPYPVVSPDERYVADTHFRMLRVTDLQSQEIIATWPTPPFPARGLLVQWSPDSREVYVGGFHGTTMGLWVYDVQSRQARRMLAGPVTTVRRSPDRSQMVIALAAPYMQIWLADIDPNVPTADAFGAARTEREHCLELIAYYNQAIETDADYLDSYQCRADCALWIDHPETGRYLEELEAAFERLPYSAAGCIFRARAILSSPQELRDPLTPLALLLARKAVEKKPQDVDFLKILGDAFYHNGDRENAEATLLRAFDLSRATSGPRDPQSAAIVHSLIQLYESWDKPFETARWRTKLASLEAAEEAENTEAAD